MLTLQQRTENCIAQGALTNSKRPECFVKGVYPTHLRNGKGCYVWDYKDKKYVDFITGLGANFLGYAHEVVNKAIAERLQAGTTLSLSTHEEVECAEKVKQLFPFVDCMKFLKTGTEACMAAIRIARAKTSRDLILSEGYHGWSDEFISLTPPALGIPKTLLKDFSAKAMDKWHEDYFSNFPILPAAIIIEPVMTDFSKERIAWLKKLREYCTKYKILLIFDEVITGFRFADYSVANHLGIEPDLIILGKSIANGMPLSLVAGKKSIMNCDEYFVSSTFAGETLSLVAASKTIELLQTKYSIKDLWLKGEAWLKEFNSLWPEKIMIEGYATRGRFIGDPLVRALFFQEACEAGILFGPSWFFNFPLAERTEVLGTLKDIICQIKSNNVKLRGEMPTTPFAQRIRQSG